VALPILGILPDYFYTILRKLFNPNNSDKIMAMQKKQTEKGS